MRLRLFQVLTMTPLNLTLLISFSSLCGSVRDLRDPFIAGGGRLRNDQSMLALRLKSPAGRQIWRLYPRECQAIAVQSKPNINERSARILGGYVLLF